MQKSIFILTLVLVLHTVAFAQKINRLDLQMPLQKAWKEKKEITDHINLFASNKTAVMEIHALGKKSNEEATLASMEILKTHKVEPEEFMKATQKTKKIGKLDCITFEMIEYTQLETQKETLVEWWTMYLTEYKGTKYVVWASEFYLKSKENKAKAEVEKMIQSIR